VLREVPLGGCAARGSGSQDPELGGDLLRLPLGFVALSVIERATQTSEPGDVRVPSRYSYDVLPLPPTSNRGDRFGNSSW
jgi:hypothetical protein